MKILYPKKLKVWDIIYVSEMYFYDDLKYNVLKASVYKKIWNEASYILDNWTYEKEFYIAFSTEKDAELYTLKELKRFKKNKIKEIDQKINYIKYKIYGNWLL